jgi:hypothetical protein
MGCGAEEARRREGSRNCLKINLFRKSRGQEDCV